MVDGHTVLNTVLAAFRPGATTEHLADERLPRGEGLGGPDPHAAGDAHDQGHEEFEHEDLDVGGGVAPLQVPRVPVGVLVQQAADEAGRRNGVQHGEDPDSHHQHLQLVRLDAVVADLFPDPEERQEAGSQEGDAQQEVDDEWGHGEAHQCGGVLVAHVAHPGQLVGVHVPHD